MEDTGNADDAEATGRWLWKLNNSAIVENFSGAAGLGQEGFGAQPWIGHSPSVSGKPRTLSKTEGFGTLTLTPYLRRSSGELEESAAQGCFIRPVESFRDVLLVWLA